MKGDDGRVGCSVERTPRQRVASASAAEKPTTTRSEVKVKLKGQP